MKITKMITMVDLPNFDEFTLYMNFANFLKMADPMAVIYLKTYLEWIRKNPGIHPSYHFCVFPSK